MTPFRVPAGTTEITYTRGSGEQRSIPIQDLGDGYVFAQGADSADDAHLAGLGLPVARKVMDEQDDDEAAAPKKTTRKSEAATPAPSAETSAGTEG